MRNKIMTDSLTLAFVKVLTMMISILSTMILSRTLSLNEYGTYSTGNILINTATSLSALGLLDAVNFYYNGKQAKDRNRYVNTVFFLIVGSGLVSAAILYVFQSNVIDYFHNPSLKYIYIYLVFRPLLANVGMALQNLQVSIGKAKVVAVRNFAISLGKLCSIIITAFFTKDIKTIFICLLLIDLISTYLYLRILKENGIFVNIFKSDFSIIGNILSYCIPMGIYIQSNVISRNLDKFVIGYFENTEQLAIYTNCSTKLPFDIVSSTLLIVLIPLLTRFIHQNNYEKSLKILKGNIKIGYTITFSLGVIIMCLSKQAILFLYGDKYLSGSAVFNLYILVDMLNFISFSIVLGAKGETRLLMMVSCLGLVCNLILNFVFYGLYGFIGPAIATVVVTFFTNMSLLYLSAKSLETSIWKLFDYPHVVKLMVQLIFVAVIINWLKIVFESYNVHYLLILVILGLLGFVIMFLFNIRELKKTFYDLNKLND